MGEAEIVLAVRQFAVELRQLVPGGLDKCAAYKLLQSVPGKGGPLVQWFNREPDQKRKRILSDILGHIARVSYQQKPEFYQSSAAELEKLCDRLESSV